MSLETIIVGVRRDGQTEQIPVEANRVDRDRDGAVRLYDDDTEIATFWNAEYAVREDNLAR